VISSVNSVRLEDQDHTKGCLSGIQAQKSLLTVRTKDNMLV